MRTETQINAFSRPYPRDAQSQRSTNGQGPVSPEGKRISSRNAETHGLLANTLVLKTESRESFLELLADLLEEHQPQTPTEYALVEMMVAARWRQRRIWGMETAGLDHEICRVDDACTTAEYNASDNVTSAAKAFRTLADDSRSLDLYSRYDARYERQFLRAERRLLELIDRRTANPTRPVAQDVVAHLQEPLAPEPPESMAPETSESPSVPEKNDSTKRTQGLSQEHAGPATFVRDTQPQSAATHQIPPSRV